MNQRQSFQLFACCLPVKGASRSLICDVQRGDFQFIPNSLYDVLKEQEGKTIEEIKAVFNNEYDETIEEYFEMLVKEEFIFFTETPELFPKMSMEWDEPAHITNAIIDINDDTEIDFLSVFKQFENLGCKHVQIRIFAQKTYNFIQNIIQQAENLRVISIEIILPFPQDFNFDKNLEDTASSFFDADNDGDFDLMVGSGGNEIEDEKNYKTRLYLNDGKGNFTKSKMSIPSTYHNTSVIAPFDFDNDGDIDVFVGSRSVPAVYGINAKHQLLENNGNGEFNDVTNNRAYVFKDLGIKISRISSFFGS